MQRLRHVDSAHLLVLPDVGEFMDEGLVRYTAPVVDDMETGVGAAGEHGADDGVLVDANEF